MKRSAVLKYMLFAVMASQLAGCDDSDDSTPSDPSNDTIVVVPKGNRVFALDVNVAEDGNYDNAFLLARDAGIDQVKLSFDWNLLETTQGFDLSLIDAMDQFFPIFDTPVTLILRPTSVNINNMPTDIASLPFDDPAVISRFNVLLDSIHQHAGSVSIPTILIGNEIDIFFGHDAVAWQQYQEFFEATRDHARSLWGNQVEIGTVVTYKGSTQAAVLPFYQNILIESDVAALTYYPINSDFTMQDLSVIASDFDNAVNLFSSKPIYFQECGYSSGTLVNSSEEKQRQFIHEVFTSWDRHPQAIRKIDFTWLTDQNEAQVDQWVIDFGLAGTANADKFKSYLLTLGLRNFAGSGSNKPAFDQLKTEAALRGW